MKKCIALLLALAMLPVFGLSASGERALAKAKAGESALAAAGADELSSLAPGRYILYYKFDGMGSLSSYQDVSIDAQADGSTISSCTPALTEPLWEEKTAVIQVDQVPDSLRFSALFIRDGQNAEQHFWTVPFAESDRRIFRSESYGSDAGFLTCSIVEDVPRLTDVDGHRWKIRSAQALDPDVSELTSGWYYAAGPITIDSRLKINGSVHLLLTGRGDIECTEGIRLSDGNSLTVWGDGPSSPWLECRADESRAGIGGNNGEDAGTFTLNGGNVKTEGGMGAAGLGGGEQGYGGDVYIHGGYIYAEGGRGNHDIYDTGAGIGGGEDRSGGTVIIDGGEVVAIGGDDEGAGIGGGSDGDQGGSVYINGGKVYAEGYNGAGIGGGAGQSGDSVYITGGEVKAVSTFGAGIGGGEKGTNGWIVISGGDVTAICKGEDGAGIGAGQDRGQGDEIIIHGGRVTAHTEGYGAGIGGGHDDGDQKGFDGGAVTITGGVVNAFSLYGAGIGGGGSEGGGNGGDGGTVHISGGLVMAASSCKGAGIGGGNDGDGGTVRISGGLVIATGGYLDYNYLEENGHMSGTVKTGMGGLGVMGGQAGSLGNDMYYSMLGDIILGWIFSGEFGGAGIGGGDDGDGGTVIITGGTVIANAGMSSARAIGRGDGGGSDGSLDIYPTAKVTMSGYNDVEPFPSEDRKYACQHNQHIEITRCDHDDGSQLREIDGYTHLITCRYCVGLTPVEAPHEHDPETLTCACGNRLRSVAVLTEEGFSAELLDHVSGSPVRYVAAGAAFDLRVYPDGGGNYRDVSAAYVTEEGQLMSLGFTGFTQEEGARVYHYGAMPDADVTIAIGSMAAGWSSLQDMIDAAENGSRIVLVTDMTAASEDGPLTIPAGKTITLDLAGHTLDRGLIRNWDFRPDGSVMFVYGDLTIMDSVGGGRLTGGCSSDFAGGIELRGGGSLTMTGGEVSGNANDLYGAGGIYVNMNSVFRVSGNTVIRNNETNGHQNNVYLNNEYDLIVPAGQLGSGACIGVTIHPDCEPTEQTTVPFTNGLSGYGNHTAFFSDDSRFAVGLNDNGEAVLGLACRVTFDPDDGGDVKTVTAVKGMPLIASDIPVWEGRELLTWLLNGEPYDFDTPLTGNITLKASWCRWTDLQLAVNRAEDGETIALDTDVAACVRDSALRIPAGKTVTLDLNGHTISRGLTDGPAAGGNVITVNGGLILTDSAGGGSVTGGWNSGSGGGIVNNGSLTILGGAVTGNKAVKAGAVLNAQGAELTVSGGALTGNSALEENGGAVLNRGVMTMTGGVIGGNTAHLDGGGVWTNGTLNLSGGSIAQNTAGSGRNGGGIFFAGGELNLSGAPTVCGNTDAALNADNLFLDDGLTAAAAGALEAGLQISVSLSEYPDGGEPAAVMTGVTAYAGGIVSDRAGYVIYRAENGLMNMIETPVFGTPDFILPASVTAIEENAFEGAAMRAALIPNGCAAIGAGAFRSCQSLTQIRIPADCVIGADAFEGCALVFVFGTAGSPAETYCAEHGNCVFVAE